MLREARGAQSLRSRGGIGAMALVLAVLGGLSVAPPSASAQPVGVGAGAEAPELGVAPPGAGAELPGSDPEPQEHAPEPPEPADDPEPGGAPAPGDDPEPAGAPVVTGGVDPAASAAAMKRGKIGVIGPSGISWDWDPSAYTPHGTYQWGSSGVDQRGTGVDLHWFLNFTARDLAITQTSFRKGTSRGTMNLSTCARPFTVPARGYAVCETSYTYAARDPEVIEYAVDFRAAGHDPFDNEIVAYNGYVTPVGPFRDVPAGHKFVRPITWMKTKKLSTGYADGSYRPLAPLSREAMAAFLYRQAGKPKFTMPRTGFSDVRPGHKFYREIMWMKASKLSTGHADGTYRPGARLSREAMAAFMYRAQGKPAFTSRGTFRDVPAGAKFSREIAWMKAAGITTGNADGTFRPRDPVTREAMAAFLYRQAGSPRV